MNKPTRLRTLLATSTVLVSGLLFVASPAMAQALPDTGNVTAITSGLTGGVPGSTNPTFNTTGASGAQTLTVNLNDNRTILTWRGTGFNVDAGNTVNFADTRATLGVSGRTDNIAVLNRVIGTGGSSAIVNGTIRSDPNVAVYIVSQGGVFFGANSSVDTGSFFALTGDLTNDNDFLSNASTLRFGSSSGADIGTNPGARFTTRASASSDGGRMGDFVLMGSRVIFNGFSGTKVIANVGGDAALIVARDVTIQNAPGSPLSFIINAGSTFSDARAFVGGDITAKNLTIAVAVAGSVTNPINLIDISGNLAATGAAQSDRGIVLSAGVESAGVSYSVTPSTDFSAAIRPNGAALLTGTLNSAKDVRVAAGNFEVDNSIVAAGIVDFATPVIASAYLATPTNSSVTGSAVTFHSNVTLYGKVTATTGDVAAIMPGGTLYFGNGVQAGGAFTAAANNVAIVGGTNVNGALDISSVNSVVLSGGTSAASININSTGLNGYVSVGGTTTSTSGNISVKSAYTLSANDINAKGSLFLQGDFTLSADSAAGSDVTLISGAAPFASAEVGTISIGSTSASAGNVYVSGRDVKVTNATANGNITLLSQGNVLLGGTSTGGNTTATGNVTLTAGSVNLNGTATLRGNVTAGGQIAVTAPSTVIIGNNGTAVASLIKAAGSVSITSNAGTISGVGALTLQSNSAGVDYGPLALSPAPLTLSAGALVSFAATTMLLGGTNRQSDVQIRLLNPAAVSLGNIQARGLLGALGNNAGFATGLTQTGPFALRGAVTLTNTLRLNGSQIIIAAPITVTGGDIDFTANSSTTIAGALKAQGDVAVRTTTGNLTIASTGSLTGANVVLSTPAAFINNAGSGAISSNHWVVYSASPSGDTFGGLDSGNTALWNATIATLPPIAASGKHYVFALQPTLTFSTQSFNKVYGTDLTGPNGAPFTVTGYQPGVAGAFLGDNAASAYSGAPLISSSGLAARATVAGGPYALSIAAGTLQSPSGYSFAFNASGQVTVTPKELVGAVTVNSKSYDGTTTGSGSVVLNGVVAGDTVGSAGTSFIFADKNAGAGKAVTISGTALTGADAGNYTLTMPATALADILKAALTGNVTINNKTYDGTISASGSVSLTGVVTGDDVGATGTSFAFVDKNAGVGKVVNVTGTTLTGADGGNYTLSIPATAFADILKAALTGTITVNNKTYDGTTAATGSLSIAGVIAGDQVGTTGSTFAFTDRNAGTGKTVTLTGTTLTGADAGNYTISIPPTALADILRAALTGAVTVNNKTYDGTTAGSGSIVLNGVVAGDAVGTGGTAFTFSDKNAGSGKTVTISGTSLTGTDAGNYTLSIPASALADILKAALTGTATVNNRTYNGTTAATGSVSLSGVVAGDNVGTTGTTFAFADKNAGTGKTVAVGGTTLTGTDAGNYTLSIPATALADILKAALTGTITANNKTYDGTTTATGSLTISGVIAGDNVGTTGSTFAFTDKNAGTGKAVTLTGTTLTGTDAGNYTLTIPASALADILKKALTGTITVNGKIYDGTTAATGSVALSGIVAGDAVSTSGSVFTFADKNAGTGKAVTVSGTTLNGVDAGNYTLNLSATALGDIARRVIALTADNLSKTQSATDPSLTYTINSGSLVTGDTFSGALTRALGELPGPYAITQGSLSAGGNYTLNFTPGTLTINLDPVSRQPQALRALTLPSQIQAQTPSSSNVTLDQKDLCGDDKNCVVK